MDITLLQTAPLTHDNNDKDLRSHSFKKNIFIWSIALVLALTAIVGACAVALAFLPAMRENASSLEVRPLEISLQDKEKLHFMVVDNQMAGRQGPALMRSDCYSSVTNDSLPLVHVSGTGQRWNEKVLISRGRHSLEVYQTYWDCRDQHNFISGGMMFRQDTQELIFPICGVYYFSSQVLFQYYSNEQNNANQSVRHGLQVTPNCGSFPSTFYHFSYSSQIAIQNFKTSTYLGDIFKMCAGGSISLIIPTSHNLCCPHGGSLNTFFSSFLLHKTPCY